MSHWSVESLPGSPVDVLGLHATGVDRRELALTRHEKTRLFISRHMSRSKRTSSAGNKKHRKAADYVIMQTYTKMAISAKTL